MNSRRVSLAASRRQDVAIGREPMDRYNLRERLMDLLDCFMQ